MNYRMNESTLNKLKRELSKKLGIDRPYSYEFESKRKKYLGMTFTEDWPSFSVNCDKTYIFSIQNLQGIIVYVPVKKITSGLLTAYEQKAVQEDLKACKGIEHHFQGPNLNENN